MPKPLSILIWTLVSLTGAGAFAYLALVRGEHVSAAWLITAALCTYAVAYRFYSKIIAAKVFALDPNRSTPAERLNDGRDYVPTNRWIVFGHHFAAIAGPGPLVGPTLAAQFGYLPGVIWIIVGVALGGAVQDFVILCASVRRNGKSIGQMAKEEIGPVAGFTALVAVVGAGRPAAGACVCCGRCAVGGRGGGLAREFTSRPHHEERAGGMARGGGSGQRVPSVVLPCLCHHRRQTGMPPGSPIFIM